MYQEEYERWLQNVTDEEIEKELKALSEKEKENKFFKALQFGTGGLRGEIGVGTNCLNVYTVARATQGVAEYVKSIGGTVAVISYDSRVKSDVFAFCSASVLAENGITTYIVKELMPTPFLSFATRYYRAAVGIMITASHNPAKYNGYKVYGGDGCQITDGAAKEITSFIERNDYFSVKRNAYETYVKAGKIRFIGDEVEEEYLRAVERQGACPVKELSVTYTPLNGTGYRIIPKTLLKMGNVKLSVVEEQAQPDGKFPTCPYPNPEKAEAMRLGLQAAAKNGSDLLLATDPDADRVGVAVNDRGVFRLMTGNEIGVLLMDFLLSVRKEKGTLPADAVVVKTIVTSKMGEKIAEKYGVRLINVLTGFKYIGEQIGKLERMGRAEAFVLGFEESYGYLSGSYVRDKDAVVAVSLICQMASYYLERGKTLVERMNELYAEYGTFEHKLLTYEFSGAAGAKKMESLLKGLRENLPASFADFKVVRTIDYLTQTQYDLPKANVLQFDLEQDAQIIVRPSGTEPQIKIYLTVAQTPKKNEAALARLQAETDRLFSE